MVKNDILTEFLQTLAINTKDEQEMDTYIEALFEKEE